MKKYKVKLIETYAFYFEVEANNRVEAEEKAKEYVDTKGMRTQVYLIKKKMLLYKYPDIDFREV